MFDHVDFLTGIIKQNIRSSRRCRSIHEIPHNDRPAAEGSEQFEKDMRPYEAPGFMISAVERFLISCARYQPDQFIGNYRHIRRSHNSSRIFFIERNIFLFRQSRKSRNVFSIEDRPAYTVHYFINNHIPCNAAYQCFQLIQCVLHTITP